MDNIMKYESTLPEGFDGTFRFTNPTNEDFVAKWGNKEYIFPAMTTSPIIMVNQTQLEIQQIRKKFAKDLAEREFFKSQQYEKIRSREGAIDDMGMITPRGQGMSHAGTYTIDNLAPMIQKCLQPLPAGQAKVKDVPTVPLEEKLSRNEEGELNTEAIDKKVSLKERARKG